MKKTYDHAVIYGGQFYPAGTPIPTESEGDSVLPKGNEGTVTESGSGTDKKPGGDGKSSK